jgi:hypothetical protein
MNGNQCIVFLCQNHELTRERHGYYRALIKRMPVVCAPLVVKNGYETLKDIVPAGWDPILILQPEASPRLPHGLASSAVPTACFQIDTYSGTEKRIRWSMLYDYAFVFHPGFNEVFGRAGHPKAICLPHAVEADLFETPCNERCYDVGWVGNLKGTIYSTRRRIIERLAIRFHMNSTERHYNAEEMAAIYKQSKVAVNVSRDDYLRDANLRCFEVMAAGALLFALRPTELSHLGFKDGTHYVSYGSDNELIELIEFYLGHEEKRHSIADAGRALVMKEHTYDSRIEAILKVLRDDRGRLFAPARHWDSLEVQTTYLHYYAKHLMLDSALLQVKEIAATSKGRALRSIPMVTKAFIRALQLSI